MPSRVSTRTSTSVMPRRVAVTVGRPTAEVAGVADDDGVGGQQLRVLLGVPLQTARALLLRALHDHLDADRHAAVRRSARSASQVHEQPALAVGRAAPVPAPVALGQLERRRESRRPRPAAAARRSARTAARSGAPCGPGQEAVDGLRAVRGVEQRHVLEALGGQRAGHPARRPSRTPRAGTGADPPPSGRRPARPVPPWPGACS